MKLLIPILVLFAGHAFAGETHCAGTEPYWNAELIDSQISFQPEPGRAKIVVQNPKYSAPTGTTENFVTMFSAKGKGNEIVGFMSDAANVLIANENGTQPTNHGELTSFCSDGQSDNLYRVSINLSVNGVGFNGCCWSRSLPAVRQD